MEENLPKDQREKIIELMINDREFRVELIKKSLYWFTWYYFGEGLKYETAEFQREMFQILQDAQRNTVVFAAGRSLGKSTIANLSAAIWNVLAGRKKFVVIVSKTQRQVEQFLQNIRYEFEHNERLRKDLGPFQEDKDQWGRTALTLGNYDAKMLAASMEQPIRGMKHRYRRPDLFILDDIEDSASVKSYDQRAGLVEWYQRDIVPTGDEQTSIIILGGILHPNSFLAHMRKSIEAGRINGIYREYALVNKEGKCIWPERYPDNVSIEALKKKIGNEISWRQEYCLEILSVEDQIVKHEWLEGQDYDKLPDEKYYAKTIISVDPAASEKERADPTAIVTISVYVIDEQSYFYVHPNPVNARLTFHEIKEKIKELYRLYARDGVVKIIVESAGTQMYITQDLQREGITAEKRTIKGDKRERLLMASAALQAKRVFFHRTGCEELKENLVGFGQEPHDDLADAFSQAINELMCDDPSPNLDVISLGGRDDDDDDDWGGGHWHDIGSFGSWRGVFGR